MDTLYSAIADELRSLIESHVYQEGETLPAEEELARMYDVSRPTVRRAVQLLEEEGFVERRPYHGTVVGPSKIEQQYAMKLQSFDDEMRGNDREPATRVIVARRDAASPEVAARLGLAEGDEVLKLVRLRYADDVPNVLVETFVPLALFPGLDTVDFATESLYAHFEAAGNPVARAHRRLELAKADPSLAALLDMAEGDPVYRFKTVTTAVSGDAVEYSVAVYRGRSNAFEFSTNPVSDDGLVHMQRVAPTDDPE